MGVSAARKIAFEVLRRVEAEGAYASDVLHAELAPTGRAGRTRAGERGSGSASEAAAPGAGIKPEDAALATELAMGVLRRRALLDLLLERHLDKPVARLDLAVAIALRMGIYQLRFLPRIPARAAVNESVELVKQARKASAASLVNAVLRRCVAEAATDAESFLPGSMALAERLSIAESHPQWMVERWLARFGEAKTVALLQSDNHPPRLSCAANDPARREEVLAELRSGGFEVQEGALLRSAFALSGGSAAATRAFRDGRISIQDEASQAVALLLDVRAGDRVLDVCAAPGGKTAALARSAGAGGFVVAGDLHLHRLRAMAAQLKRVGASCVRLVNLDATVNLPFGAEFDRILVDAPCSGTGTLARHPEIRWRLRRVQLGELHALQVAILSRALARLARGGQLVYSTCSLEPEENEEVIAEALSGTESVRALTGAEIAPTLKRHLAAGVEARELVSELGIFRTLPGQQATDGFFAAVLERG